MAIRTIDYTESKQRAVLASILYLQINRQLQAAITNRIDSSEQTSRDGLKHFQNIRSIAFLALALAILLMSWLGLILTQSIVSPLKKVIAVFNNISDGHYDSRIRIIGKDEMSKVMTALQAMQIGRQ
jgi:methyl-accepting chemotaxis protein